MYFSGRRGDKVGCLSCYYGLNDVPVDNHCFFGVFCSGKKRGVANDNSLEVVAFLKNTQMTVEE